MVYKIVSEAPISMHRVRLSGLSGPRVEKMLSATAVVALPENGRRSRAGRIFDDTPNIEVSGDRKSHSMSTAPLEVSI